MPFLLHLCECVQNELPIRSGSKVTFWSLNVHTRVYPRKWATNLEVIFRLISRTESLTRTQRIGEPSVSKTNARNGLCVLNTCLANIENKPRGSSTIYPSASPAGLALQKFGEPLETFQYKPERTHDISIRLLETHEYIQHFELSGQR